MQPRPVPSREDAKLKQEVKNMTLTDFLSVVEKHEAIYLRATEDEPIKKWISEDDKIKYGNRMITEISTIKDEFFFFPIIVVRIEGEFV